MAGSNTHLFHQLGQRRAYKQPTRCKQKDHCTVDSIFKIRNMVKSDSYIIARSFITFSNLNE